MNPYLHLPPLNELKRRLTNNPDLINYILKYDCLIGDTESIEYIDKISKKVE